MGKGAVRVAGAGRQTAAKLARRAARSRVWVRPARSLRCILVGWGEIGRASCRERVS